MGRKIEWFLVAAIASLGGALRIWSPKMSSDLWYDEVFSLFVAQQPFGGMLHSLYLGVPTGARMDPGDTNPPLYPALLHLWLTWGGSDAHIKHFSVVFGVASIWVIYLLGRKLGGKFTGLAASILLAVSPLAIYYSIEARPYAMFLFFGLLSTCIFVSAILKPDLEERSQLRAKTMLIGYVVATVLAVYTHWFGLLLLPVHAVGLTIYRPGRVWIRRYLVASAGIAACCLPLVPLLWNQIALQSTVGGFRWPGRPGLRSLLDIALLVAGGRTLLALNAVFFLIVYLGKSRHLTRPGTTLFKNNLFLFICTLLPVVIVYTASNLMESYTFFVPRYFLPFLAGVYVLVALSLARIEWKMALLWTLVFAVTPMYEAARRRQAPVNPYSLIASRLSSQDETGVLIAHLSPASYYPLVHYGRSSAAPDKVLWEASSGSYDMAYNAGGKILGENDLVDIGAELRSYRELWIIEDPVAFYPETQSLAERFRNDDTFSLVSEEEYGDVILRHYLRSVSNAH